MYDEKSGKITVDKSKTSSTMYDWEIVSGSTIALDEKSQQENLSALIQMFTANPQVGMQLVEWLNKEGFTVKVGEMFKKMISKSGIQDWDKILVEKTEGEKQDEILAQHQQQLQMAMQQMMGQTMGSTPAQPQMPQEMIGGQLG